MAIDFEEMAALIELLKQLEFTDFRFQKGDLIIAVRRGGLLTDEVTTHPNNSVKDETIKAKTPNAGFPVPTPPLAAMINPTASAAPAAFAPDHGDHIVTAPLLGIFYGSPKPGDPPFVTAGAQIMSDDPLCVIEVMKLYNSVTAGVSGTVTAVLVSDGQLVEFGQPLFAIKVDT